MAGCIWPRMQPVVARVFEITGAEAVFTVHDTLAGALNA